MKRYFWGLILFLTSFTSTFAQDGADYCSQGKIKAFARLNKTSQVLYPGDSNIDVTYYKLDLTVTINPNYLSGIITVKARPAKSPINTFYLDLVNALHVTSVILTGINLNFSQPQNSNQLVINLDRAYSLGEEFSVAITYGGIPTSGSGFISQASFSFRDSTAAFYKTVVSSLSEPYGARDWWPSKDTPADKVDSSDVWITADKFFVSVSNGSLVGTVDNSDGTRTYKWKNHYPIANYLISIAMTNYQTINDQFEYESEKFLPVIHYCYPERIDNTRRNAVAKTIDMLKIYSEKFGHYPYLKEKYGHAEFAWGGGMEHQTITSMGGGAMNSENVIAHELAHQWFGDKVTCKDWQNIWLNEGFASYCECIYREAKYGTADFKNYVDNFMNNPNNGAKKAVGTIYVQNISSESEIFNSARSYKKGAIVLHMLRGIVGNDKFFQIMHEYANEPGLAYNVATTEDFKLIAERVSGLDLKYFFDEWIYGENYPIYLAEWSYKSDVNGTYKISLKLTQTLNSNPKFFTMPIQLAITTAQGTSKQTLINNSQIQTFELTVNGEPFSIQIDPDNWILKTISGIVFLGNDDLLPGVYSLNQNYPNPFNNGTSIRYEIQTSVHVTLKIYDELGNFIKTIVDETKPKGKYEVKFDAQKLNLSSGVYYYKLDTGNYTETRKMVFLK